MKRATRGNTRQVQEDVDPPSNTRTRQRKKQKVTEDMGNNLEPEQTPHTPGRGDGPRSAGRQSRKTSKSKQMTAQPCQSCPVLQLEINQLQEDLGKARAKIKDEFPLTLDDPKRNTDYRKQRDEAERQLKIMQQQLRSAKQTIEDQQQHLEQSSKIKRTNANDEKYIQKYEQICGELKENKAKLKDKQEQLKDTLTGVNDLQNTIVSLKEDLKVAKSDNDRLLHRISILSGAKLTSENPDLVDISDENRPTKLAERFLSLYDDHWTDAYAALTEAGKEERKTIEILLQVLTNTYIECRRYTSQDYDAFKTNVISCFKFDPQSGEAMALCQQYIDRRKKIYQNMKPDIVSIGISQAPGVNNNTRHETQRDNNFGSNSSDYDQEMPQSQTTDKSLALRGRYALNSHPLNSMNTIKKIDERLVGILSSDEQILLKPYIDETLDICLLMCIQDPPVFIPTDIDKEDSQFDQTLYKAYMNLSKQIEYVVWPPSYLYNGGSMLSKGVAEGKHTLETKPPLDKNDNKERPTSVSSVQLQEKSISTDSNTRAQSAVIVVGDDIPGTFANKGADGRSHSGKIHGSGVKVAVVSSDTQSPGRQINPASSDVVSASVAKGSKKRKAPLLPDVYDSRVTQL